MSDTIVNHRILWSRQGLAMGIRRIKNEQGGPIDDLRPGDNVHRALRDLYEYGRQYPNSRPHDYAGPEHAPPRRQPAPPSHEHHVADYRPVKSSPVSSPADQSQPQFAVEKSADLNDVGRVWTRGMSGESPHPHFDAGPSGSRYSTKVRR
jgi:hypothetical protein